MKNINKKKPLQKCERTDGKDGRNFENCIFPPTYLAVQKYRNFTSRFLDEILNLIWSVSEGFPSYSFKMMSELTLMVARKTL